MPNVRMAVIPPVGELLARHPMATRGGRMCGNANDVMRTRFTEPSFPFAKIAGREWGVPVPITDRREIEFDMQSVRLLLEWSPRSAQAFGLPPLTPQGVHCNPTDGTIEVTYGELTSTRVFVLRAEALGAILIAYCNRAGMPMPRHAGQGGADRARACRGGVHPPHGRCTAAGAAGRQYRPTARGGARLVLDRGGTLTRHLSRLPRHRNVCAGGPGGTMTNRVELRIDERIAFAGGHPFGDVGAYERLTGRALFAVDPRPRRSRTWWTWTRRRSISHGLVHFAADFMILKPIELERGNRRVFYDYGNRGQSARCSSTTMRCTAMRR